MLPHDNPNYNCNYPTLHNVAGLTEGLIRNNRRIGRGEYKETILHRIRNHVARYTILVGYYPDGR